MKHKLLPHQRRALEWASDRERIALFMEMRLGKTPVSIRWAKRTGAGRVLVVAPLSTIHGVLNWEGELAREGIDATSLSRIPQSKRVPAMRQWVRIVKPVLMDPYLARMVAKAEHPSKVPQFGQQVIGMKRKWRRGWYLINYEGLRSNPAILTAPWDAIILDESTKIRSPRSQITKLITRHSAHITYKAILSGLPNPEDAADFFSQFQFLDGRFLGYDNFWAFRQRYFLTVGFGWHPKRGTRDLIKDEVGRRAFVLTRKQAGVGSEKVRQQRTVQLNAAQKKLLREMKTNFSVGGEETKWVPVVHTWMSHVAGGFHPKTKAMVSDSKLRELEHLLLGELKEESVVVWFRFNHEIEAAYKWLKERKVSIEYLHGAVANSKEKRPKVQERFQSGKTRVLLMQVKLGKYGWNLSRSSTAIYYSNSYEFEDRSQSEDRIVHLTKKNDCLYIDLVSEGTPDETVVEALTDKRMNAKLFSARIKQFVNQLVA